MDGVKKHSGLRERGRIKPWQAISTSIAVAILAITGVVAASADGNRSAHPLAVKVVMGYTANVQFAPFYAAVKLGYYKAAGLNPQFNYTTEPNALRLLAEGSQDFVDSGGDEVMAAGASGLGVKYVLTQYSRFPAALFFLKHNGINSVKDLKGKTIGIPFEAGASYFGLLALLRANHVPVSSVTIEPVGYNQVTEVAERKVDAAMGYAPNEPVELRALGKKVGEFDVYRWANIAGAGIATSNSLIKKNPKEVRAFVKATLKGMRYVIAHPAKAFQICRESIPGLTGLNVQRAVLYRAIHFWKPAGAPLGHMAPSVWKLTAKILLQNKVIPHKVDAKTYYTNRFLG